MVLTSFTDANILNIFSGGSLLPGHTVTHVQKEPKLWAWALIIGNDFRLKKTISLRTLGDTTYINSWTSLPLHCWMAKKYFVQGVCHWINRILMKSRCNSDIYKRLEEVKITMGHFFSGMPRRLFVKARPPSRYCIFTVLELIKSLK